MDEIYKIISDPETLKITNKDIEYCPICNNLLIKTIEKRCVYERKCDECSYNDRPFGYNRSNKGPCTCIREYQNCLIVMCNDCLLPRCSSCNKKLNSNRISQSYVCNDCLPKCILCNTPFIGKHICVECQERQEKILFNQKWKKSTPQEKLQFYGLEKLKILAKNKGIKNISRYNNCYLLNTLIPIVNDSDFPIH